MEEENIDDLIDGFRKAGEIFKSKMRKHLMDKTAEERFNVLRNDFSLENLNLVCEWAIPEEDYEICDAVQKVIANNENQFELKFAFDNSNENSALVVKFKKDDEFNYYHVDYKLNDGTDDSILNLVKIDGEWTSNYDTNDERLYKPIGMAIDHFENGTPNN
jgi:hypothetical protein